MAVRDGRVSFVARSTVARASLFSELIGLEPTGSTEIGEPRAPSGRSQEVAVWWLDQDFTDDEPHAFNVALLSLLLPFIDHEAMLAKLRESFELSVRCFGSSDSSQGGFWLSAETMGLLGRVGANFHCTVYLEDAAPDDM